MVFDFVRARFGRWFTFRRQHEGGTTAPLPSPRADFQHEIWSARNRSSTSSEPVYPNSTNLAAAVLYQAEARYKLKQFTNAITLLSTNRDKAGPLADAYHYWIGEAQFQTRDFTNAAATFVSLARDYPNHPCGCGRWWRRRRLMRALRLAAA